MNNNDSLFAYFEEERDTTSRNLYGHATRFKEYPRFPRTALPEAPPITTSLSSLLTDRHTTREFTRTPMTLEELSTLAYWTFGNLGERPETTHGVARPHPSGGAKYPIELYPIVLNVEGIDAGTYHYSVPHHALEKLPNSVSKQDLAQAFRYDFVADASVIFCYTFMKSRSIGRYGGFAYKVGLIEAGNIGQNVYLASAALNLGCCALGGGDRPLLYDALGIDGGNEHMVYAIAIGTVR